MGYEMHGTPLQRQKKIIYMYVHVATLAHLQAKEETNTNVMDLCFVHQLIDNI